MKHSSGRFGTDNNSTGTDCSGADSCRKSVRLLIEGIVQGVGFRPFLHRLADRHHIGGWVRNTSSGLEGVLRGTPESVEHFLAELKSSPPPMAFVESVRTEDIKTNGDSADFTDFADFSQFTVLESRTDQGATLISPDIAMCPECEAELYNPSDRRYRYPFINCTNCGPRYTIIEALPYDRDRTVMNEFEMCDACSQEYRSIRDRRYHAQPDCCPRCGPQVFYVEQGRRTAEGDPALQSSQNLLAEGGILAVKGIGGIHLACSALDARAVSRLRERKHRAEKPLAVMCRSIDAVRRICRITPEEERILTSPARPIVLLAKKDPSSLKELSFSRRLGVMLPYSPLHTLLLDGVYGGPDILVMTSGNTPGCPVLTENSEALSLLEDTADGFLLHNRRILNRCDDSLAAEWRGKPYFLRRSRGYAPRPLEFKQDDGSCSISDTPRGTCRCAFNSEQGADGIFALGAEQKASFALGKDSHIFLSPYIGDLKNAETFAHYRKTLETYETLFRLKPSLYVCDLHPDYLSVQEALRAAGEKKLPLLQVQHHWAHMASCMADNNLDTSCFGIIWDGTGMGTDGKIWGGEFLTGDFASFKRTGSIRPVLLPGGDRSIREIGRIALALIRDAGIDDLSRIPLPEEKCRMLTGLLSSDFSPSASSIGRLFDGVCALLLNRSQADYEGEGAALVESLSPAETPEQLKQPLRELSYPMSFYEQDSLRIFDTRPVIRCITEELHRQTDPGRIALRFMATLACMALDQCAALNPDRLPVVLSGGVFQNRFLLHGVVTLLEDEGFTVYTHHRVSTNDEGICLGQLAIARKKRSMNHVSCHAHENQ